MLLTAHGLLIRPRPTPLHLGRQPNFRHLKALASLDCDLRYALLPLMPNVENETRTKLVRLITELEDEGLS